MTAPNKDTVWVVIKYANSEIFHAATFCNVGWVFRTRAAAVAEQKKRQAAAVKPTTRYEVLRVFMQPEQ